MMRLRAAVWTLASLTTMVAGQVVKGNFTLGVWLDDPDRPDTFNARMGLKMGSFEAAQSIPYDHNNVTGEIFLDPWQPKQWAYSSNVTAWKDGTDASVFMTVYADMDLTALGKGKGMDLVTDDAITHLAIRMHDINVKTGRKVLMRWLPEMNGPWMLYGQQPNAYVALWIRMANIFRKSAPDVKLVWSPNLDIADTSYWPGAQYVDIVGCSVYFKGYGVNPVIDQAAATSQMGGCYSYADQYNKPFLLSETGAGYESGVGIGTYAGVVVSDQTDKATFQKSYWAGILSKAIWAQFPHLEAAYIFEVAKQEEDFYRDYRLSVDPDVRSAFLQLVSTVNDSLIWGNPVGATTSSMLPSISATVATSVTAPALPTAAPSNNGDVATTGSSSSKSGASSLSCLGPMVILAVTLLI
ncbi:glycoside hydrolase superfamily [Chytriomyces sp. MP71]|nr:glycoside hydrolase superfamily [Chytriomyces sp. MP71]